MGEAITSAQPTLAGLRRALRHAIAIRDAAARWGMAELVRLEERQIAALRMQIAHREIPPPPHDAPPPDN
jgi:hypothetical protein